MLDRRTLLLAVTAMSMPGFTPVAWAADPVAYDPQAFAAAQRSGKPILVEITAPWCPTCKAQKPILGKLTAAPEFKDLAMFNVDFDSQKDVVRIFGARMQSTLIVFKDDKELGRSVGDTDPDSIKRLLDKLI